jgi:hypothetical protein
VTVNVIDAGRSDKSGCGKCAAGKILIVTDLAVAEAVSTVYLCLCPWTVLIRISKTGKMARPSCPMADDPVERVGSAAHPAYPTAWIGNSAMAIHALGRVLEEDERMGLYPVGRMIALYRIEGRGTAIGAAAAPEYAYQCCHDSTLYQSVQLAHDSFSYLWQTMHFSLLALP